MNGPFSDYSWGDTYESMHQIMYRMKERDPAPQAAHDEQLEQMWERAYEAYQTSCRVLEVNAAVLEHLQGRLAEARAAEDCGAESSILERLAAVELTAEATTAVEARIQHAIEWLEMIDAEFQRRPWLSTAASIELDQPQD